MKVWFVIHYSYSYEGGSNNQVFGPFLTWKAAHKYMNALIDGSHYYSVEGFQTQALEVSDDCENDRWIHIPQDYEDDDE